MEKNNDGEMRAYIYGRYSSHAQKDTSIEQQFAEIRAYCKQAGIKIVGEYADRAISGKTDNRPEFQKMIKDCARGKVQRVVCWKVDRFARNRYDAATYKARLKKYGVRVQYAKESIPDGPEGVLLESILEGSAEYYSANLSQNVKRGLAANAAECKVNQKPPLGYRKGPDGRFEIDPDGAAVIREIFDLYVNADMSIVEICGILNGRGLRTSLGNKFTKGSFHRMLKNEHYIGVYHYGDVRVEGGVPAIISRDLFDAAQEKITRHAWAPRRSADNCDYLLTGRLFCGNCGSPMVGVSGTGKSGRKYHYYACMGQKRLKKCDKTPIKKDVIEAEVVKYTVNYVLNDDFIEKVAGYVVDLQARERQNNDEEKALKRQLVDVEKRIKNVMAAIEDGIYTPTTKERLTQLEEQRAQTLAALDDISIKTPDISREDIVALLRQYRSGDPNDPDFQWKIIQNFINAVYVFDDTLRIAYNYGSGEDIVPLDAIINNDAAGEGFVLSDLCPTPDAHLNVVLEKIGFPRGRPIFCIPVNCR